MPRIRIENLNGIFILQIERPEALNALNRATLIEMRTFLEKTAYQQKAKAIILTGGESKAFISGADIHEMNQLNPEEMVDFCALGQHVANLLENSPFLTIAAVNGYAFGGGFEIALACDLICASSHAVFGFPEVTLGLIPAFGGTQRLTRLLGPHLAKELILTGRRLSAVEAKDLRLINYIYDTRLIAECETIAQTIIQHSWPAIINGKRAINAALAYSMEKGLEKECTFYMSCFQTSERRAAMDAFIHKTKTH